MKIRGIDVSQFQGNINFADVKASGIDFVIIRAGYGRYLSQKDPWFEANYKKAKAAGLNVGAYWYSYAKNASEALQEANVCLQAIKGKTFEMPIYFDLEEGGQFALGKSVCSAMVEAFCDRLENAGYFAGLYMSRSPIMQYISDSVQKKYTLWIAEYGNGCAYKGSGVVDMWQFTSSLRIAGINGNVDGDVSYRDFPSVIKNGGYNGFPKPVKKAEEKKASKPETKTEKPVENKASTEFERGDVNGDGKINVTDITKLAAHIKGKKPLKNK